MGLKFIAFKDATTGLTTSPKGIHKVIMLDRLHHRSAHRVSSHGLSPGWKVFKQQARSQDFKAVTTPRPINHLRYAVQGFRVAVANGVVEVGKNLFPPVPRCDQKRSKTFLPFLHGGRNGIAPLVQPLACRSLARCVIDVVKRFLEPVCRCHVGFIVQPHLKIEPAFLVQALVAQPQQGFTPHPVLASGFILILCQRDSNVVHRLVCHLDDMELVNDHRQAGEYGLSRILVRSPHINRQPLDHPRVLEVIQPGRDAGLVSVREHVYGQAVHHVRDDAAQLSINLCFINAQPFRKPRLVLDVELGNIVTSQVANGLVVATDMLCDPDEGIAQALRLDVVNTPDRHAHFVLYATQGLNERAAALTALVPLGVGKDANRAATDRAISDVDWLRAVLVKVAYVPAFGAGGWRNGVFSFNQVLFAIKGLVDDVPAIEVENVSHLLLSCIALPTGTIVTEKYPIALIEFGLIKWDAIGMQESVRVSQSDNSVGLDGQPPVIWLIIPNITPFALSMIRTLNARRPRRVRPPHISCERNTVTAIHSAFNQRIPIRPLFSSHSRNSTYFINADAEPVIYGLNALSICPSFNYFPLPVRRTVICQLSNISALRCEYRHQECISLLPPVKVTMFKLTPTNAMKNNPNAFQRRGYNLVHIAPSSALLALGVNNYRKVGSQMPLHYKGSNCRRLDAATRRPKLSTHNDIPHVIPNYEYTSL